MQNGGSFGQSESAQLRWLTISQKLSQEASQNGSKRWTDGEKWWSTLVWLLERWQPLVWDLKDQPSRAECKEDPTSSLPQVLIFRDTKSEQPSLASTTISTSSLSMANPDTQDYSFGWETGKSSQWRSLMVASWCRLEPCLNILLAGTSFLDTTRSSTLKPPRLLWRRLRKKPPKEYREGSGEFHQLCSHISDTMWT